MFTLYSLLLLSGWSQFCTGQLIITTILQVSSLQRLVTPSSASAALGHGVKVVRLKVAIDKRLTVVDERSPAVLKYKTPHFRFHAFLSIFYACQLTFGFVFNLDGLFVYLLARSRSQPSSRNFQNGSQMTTIESGPNWSEVMSWSWLNTGVNWKWDGISLRND